VCDGLPRVAARGGARTEAHRTAQFQGLIRLAGPQRASAIRPGGSLRSRPHRWRISTFAPSIQWARRAHAGCPYFAHVIHSLPSARPCQDPA
jgi:hypothetical protein